jgi:hypothetical protein
MQDEKYSAYLKEQSNAGLMWIRGSLDKDTQAERYEMVLAEIAERDTRGERNEIPKTNRRGTQLTCAQPAAVAKAVTLLYTSLAIGVVHFLLFAYWTLNLPVDHGLLAMGTLISFAFTFWLIYNINEGRNAARVVLLVMFLVWLPFHIRGLIRVFSFSFICDGLILTGDALQIFALTLLFSHHARPWFHPLKTNPQDIPNDPDDNA